MDRQLNPNQNFVLYSIHQEKKPQFLINVIYILIILLIKIVPKKHQDTIQHNSQKNFQGFVLKISPIKHLCGIESILCVLQHIYTYIILLTYMSMNINQDNGITCNTNFDSNDHKKSSFQSSNYVVNIIRSFILRTTCIQRYYCYLILMVTIKILPSTSLLLSKHALQTYLLQY